MIDWTPELKSEIVERLTSGESIASIFRTPEFPTRQSFYLQLARDESFLTDITRARKSGVQYQVDDFIELADTANSENYNAIKTRLWARTWILSKIAPELYGDKLDLNHGGTVELALSERLKSARASLKE